MMWVDADSKEKAQEATTTRRPGRSATGLASSLLQHHILLKPSSSKYADIAGVVPHRRYCK